jgi:hypothetical protein
LAKLDWLRVLPSTRLEQLHENRDRDMRCRCSVAVDAHREFGREKRTDAGRHPGFNHITIFSLSYPSHSGFVLLQACSARNYAEQGGVRALSNRGLCLEYKHEPPWFVAQPLRKKSELI